MHNVFVASKLVSTPITKAVLPPSRFFFSFPRILGVPRKKRERKKNLDFFWWVFLFFNKKTKSKGWRVREIPSNCDSSCGFSRTKVSPLQFGGGLRTRPRLTTANHSALFRVRECVCDLCTPCLATRNPCVPLVCPFYFNSAGSALKFSDSDTQTLENMARRKFTKIRAKFHNTLGREIIDLLMGLFRGAVFPHGGAALKQRN